MRRTDKAASLSRSRRALFTVITIAFPFLLLGMIELGLRVLWPSARVPLFTTVQADAGLYLLANPRSGTRWFRTELHPPAPMPDPFAVQRPPRALRIFVLGESTTAGFPYPHNVAFSRMLRDALRDALPTDSVEVVNLGVAATNTFTMLDMADEVIAQRPSAVLIYAGHNEYYGVMGAASTQSNSSALAARVVQRLERLRLVAAMERGIDRVRRRNVDTTAQAAASFMEILARDQSIGLGSDVYRRGVRQYDENLSALLTRFRDAGIPVFVGSLTSNLRDQAPFVSPTNDLPGGARAIYADAQQALARGDTAGARTLFIRARDADVVRFRAPSELNDVVRRVAAATGAVYVPVAESFAAASPGGIPGHELFLEHVHPTKQGYALLARSFFEALRADARFGSTMRPERLRSWEDYERGMELTGFDERVAQHTLRTLMSRWPFVPVAEQRDYRATYRPVGLSDSLAFDVSRGATWSDAKLVLARDFERRGLLDSAVAEYRGLVRDSPIFGEPLRLLGQALLASKRVAEADTVLRASLRLRPTADAARALGTLAIERHDLRGGAEMLSRSLQLEPRQPAVLYQLSLTYGLLRDLPAARASAMRLARLDPGYPGLAGWMSAIGLSR